MQIKFCFCILGIVALVFSATAQTNFDVLICQNASYTNATIIRATPAYVVVDHSGGIAKVALTNLPTILQIKYHYDPAAAEDAINEESLRADKSRKEVAARAEAYKKYLASLAGPVKTIHLNYILSDNTIGGAVYDTSVGTIQLSGVPEDLNSKLRRAGELINEIKHLKTDPIVATASVSNSGDDQFNAQMAVDDALQAAKNSRDAKLAAAKDEQTDLKDDLEKSAEIRANNTGQKYQYAMWQYDGIPEAIAAEK
jgi:hypothetical protein